MRHAIACRTGFGSDRRCLVFFLRGDEVRLLDIGGLDHFLCRWRGGHWWGHRHWCHHAAVHHHAGVATWRAARHHRWHWFAARHRRCGTRHRHWFVARRWARHWTRHRTFRSCAATMFLVAAEELATHAEETTTAAAVAACGGWCAVHNGFDTAAAFVTTTERSHVARASDCHHHDHTVHKTNLQKGKSDARSCTDFARTDQSIALGNHFANLSHQPHRRQVKQAIQPVQLPQSPQSDDAPLILGTPVAKVKQNLGILGALGNARSMSPHSGGGVRLTLSKRFRNQHSWPWGVVSSSRPAVCAAAGR